MIYPGGFFKNSSAKNTGTVEAILTTEVNFRLGLSMGVKHGLYLDHENAYLLSE